MKTKRVLTLHVKFEYFDAMESGAKTHEFRLVKTWQKRLNPEGLAHTAAVFDEIVIYRGYTKTRLVRPWRGWEIRRLKHPHFGPDEVHVYAIRIN